MPRQECLFHCLSLKNHLSPKTTFVRKTTVAVLGLIPLKADSQYDATTAIYMYMQNLQGPLVPVAISLPKCIQHFSIQLK